MGQGLTTLNLEYRRPWETNVLPARTFDINVRVVAPTANVPSPAAVVEDAVPATGAGLMSAYNWCDLGAALPSATRASVGAAGPLARSGRSSRLS